MKPITIILTGLTLLIGIACKKKETVLPEPQIITKTVTVIDTSIHNEIRIGTKTINTETFILDFYLDSFYIDSDSDTAVYGNFGITLFDGDLNTDGDYDENTTAIIILDLNSPNGDFLANGTYYISSATDTDGNYVRTPQTLFNAVLYYDIVFQDGDWFSFKTAETLVDGTVTIGGSGNQYEINYLLTFYDNSVETTISGYFNGEADYYYDWSDSNKRNKRKRSYSLKRLITFVE